MEALARIKPVKRSVADVLRGLRTRFEDPPLQAMTMYVVERLDADDLPAARLGMGAIYADHLGGVPPALRQELDVIAAKLKVEPPRRRRRRRRAKVDPIETIEQLDAFMQTALGPPVDPPPLQREGARAARPRFRPAPAFVPAPVIVSAPTALALVVAAVPPPPPPPSARDGWLLLTVLALGIGAAHWSDQ